MRCPLVNIQCPVTVSDASKVAKARSPRYRQRRHEEDQASLRHVRDCARSVGEVLILESTPTSSCEGGLGGQGDGEEALPRRTPHTTIDNHYDPWCRRRMQCVSALRNFRAEQETRLRIGRGRSGGFVLCHSMPLCAKPECCDDLGGFPLHRRAWISVTIKQDLAATGDFQILDGLGRAGACCPCFPLVARPVGPVKSVPSWVRTKS